MVGRNSSRKITQLIRGTSSHLPVKGLFTGEVFPVIVLLSLIEVFLPRSWKVVRNVRMADTR